MPCSSASKAHRLQRWVGSRPGGYAGGAHAQPLSPAYCFLGDPSDRRDGSPDGAGSIPEPARLDGFDSQGAALARLTGNDPGICSKSGTPAAR